MDPGVFVPFTWITADTGCAPTSTKSRQGHSLRFCAFIGIGIEFALHRSRRNRELGKREPADRVEDSRNRGLT